MKRIKNHWQRLIFVIIPARKKKKNDEISRTNSLQTYATSWFGNCFGSRIVYIRLSVLIKLLPERRRVRLQAKVIHFFFFKLQALVYILP